MLWVDNQQLECIHMGLLILIVVGALLGWLGSIVTRTEDRKGIFFNVLVGATGSALAGTLSNSGSILLDISASALLIAFGATIVVLALFNLWRLRTQR